jgi:hypothetical protein
MRVVFIKAGTWAALLVFFVGLSVSACGPSDSPSAPPPASTAFVEETAIPSAVKATTAIPVPATVAPQPTSTSVPQTATPVPLTVTPVPATVTPTATAQAATPTVEPAADHFEASSQGKAYHYPWCTSAKRIKASNLVTFSSPCEAVAAGYSPCKNCNPPGCE